MIRTSGFSRQAGFSDLAADMVARLMVEFGFERGSHLTGWGQCTR
ncbi:MAG: hypothetical protein SFH39_16830 [Candidatus Magnetobacterium sp. LHC-1]